jgi:hypothetical protein
MALSNKRDAYLDACAQNLVIVLEILDLAAQRITQAYDGNLPGEPTPDSANARAWDYADAIVEARKAIGNRLNTWDKGDYDE